MSGEDFGDKNNADSNWSDVANEEFPTLRPGKFEIVIVFFDFQVGIFCAPDPADENGGQHASYRQKVIGSDVIDIIKKVHIE